MKRGSIHAIVIGAAALAAACVATDSEPGADATEASTEVRADAVLEAVWSPDGRRLAATWLQGGRTRLVGFYGPYEGEPPAESSGLPLADGEAGWASWSRDGLWVAYAAGGEGSREIVRARPDGTGPENLTSHPADDYDPAYSPDGRTLAFVSTRDGGVPKLHLMDADGREPRVLADLGGAVRRPMWSPDGRKLAVQLTDRGQEAIYVVSADGSGWGRMGPGLLPSWIPDGRGVTFTENDSLFWRPSEGGSRRFLAADARAGRTSPDGRWMAFVRGDSLKASLYLADMETGAETRITPP